MVVIFIAVDPGKLNHRAISDRNQIVSNTKGGNYFKKTRISAGSRYSHPECVWHAPLWVT